MAGRERYAVVSCHVERPLDDRVWARFAALQERRPGGFRIAALIRPAGSGARRGRDGLARAGAGGGGARPARAPHALDGARPRAPDRRRSRRARARGGRAAARARASSRRSSAAAAGTRISGSPKRAPSSATSTARATAYRPAYLAAGRAAARARGARHASCCRRAPAARRSRRRTRSACWRGTLLLAGGLGADVVHVHFHDTDLARRRAAAARSSGRCGSSAARARPYRSGRPRRRRSPNGARSAFRAGRSVADRVPSLRADRNGANRCGADGARRRRAPAAAPARRRPRAAPLRPLAAAVAGAACAASRRSPRSPRWTHSVSRSVSTSRSSSASSSTAHADDLLEPALGRARSDWLRFAHPDHADRLLAGGPLRAARAAARSGTDRLVADPRRRDRARVRDRHGLRLLDHRARPDGHGHGGDRDRRAAGRLRVDLARAPARGRCPPARDPRRRGREPRAPAQLARLVARRASTTRSSAPSTPVGAAGSAGARRRSTTCRDPRAHADRRADPQRGATSTSARCSRWSRPAHRRGVKVRLAPRTTELLVQQGEYVPGQGVPLFELRPPVLDRRGLGREARRSTSSSRRSSLVVGLPLWLLLALAIKLDSRGPVFYVDRRIGVGEREFGMLKFRTMVADAAERQAELEARERGERRALQDPRRPARHPRRPPAPAALDRRAPAGAQRPPRRDEPRRAAAAAAARLPAARRLAPQALPRAAGGDRSLADLGPLQPHVRRSRPARLHVSRELVDLARHLDHPARRCPPSSPGSGAY